MNTLILVFRDKQPQAAEVHHALVGEEATHDSDGQVSVTSNGKKAYMYPLLGAESEVFEDWPAEAVPAHPKLLALDYRDPALAQRLVLHLARRFEFIVDTNFGLLLSSADFLARAEADRTWSWVQEVKSPYGDAG